MIRLCKTVALAGPEAWGRRGETPHNRGLSIRSPSLNFEAAQATLWWAMMPTLRFAITDPYTGY